MAPAEEGVFEAGQQSVLERLVLVLRAFTPGRRLLIQLILPIKALNRWVRGDTIIKNKKENESTAQLEERIEKMMRVIRDKVLAWFERTPRVQGELGAWKDDVQLAIVMAAEGHESRGTRLARYLSCC